MAWLGNNLYSVAAIRYQERKRAKAALKKTRKEKEADFADQVQSAIEAGIPVTIVPYVHPPKWERKQKKNNREAELLAEIERLKQWRKDKPAYRQGMGSEFYNTWEWRDIRWKVLTASNGKCKVCNRGKDDGVILHVDHIKPRSKYPLLELVFENLQVLCEDCNVGKSNK